MFVKQFRYMEKVWLIEEKKIYLLTLKIEEKKIGERKVWMSKMKEEFKKIKNDQ